MIDEIVKIELAELKADLKKGDEVITETSMSGKEVKHSKKVGEARMKFMNLMRGLLESKSITAQEATKGTNEFGRKTTNIYWIK